MTTDIKAVARFDAHKHGEMRWDVDGTYVLFTDHAEFVDGLERLVCNVETENEFLRHALAASRAEVERLNLVIRGKSGQYGFAEAVASEGFDND